MHAPADGQPAWQTPGAPSVAACCPVLAQGVAAATVWSQRG
jgi:hypothetical protein